MDHRTANGGNPVLLPAAITYIHPDYPHTAKFNFFSQKKKNRNKVIVRRYQFFEILSGVVVDQNIVECFGAILVHPQHLFLLSNPFFQSLKLHTHTHSVVSLNNGGGGKTVAFLYIHTPLAHSASLHFLY